MKYIFISFSVLLILTGKLNAQKWENLIGYNNINDGMLDMLECYDNGYLISGGSEMHEGIWIIKTDINGEIIWDKIIEHNNHILTAGYIDQNINGEIAIGTVLSFSNGNQWPLVIKMDSCGNKLWCRYYIDNNYSHGWFRDLILFENGDILALGYMFSFESYTERIFLYYIDSNGNLSWRQSYSSKEDHPLVLEREGAGLHQLNNEFIISGECYYPYPGNPGTGYKRPFYIGIDNEFKEKWILPFGVNDSIIGSAFNLIPLNDSIYMGIGFKWENGEDQNSILMFFNSNGEELGYKQIYNDAIGPNVTDNITGDIARLNDSLFITTALFGPGAGINANGEFIIDTAANIYKIEQRPNTRGRSVLIKTFDEKFTIGCNYKHPSSDYDIYLYKINDSLEMDTVYTGNYTYDSLCPYPIESGIIDITDCLLETDVREIPTPQEYFASLNTVPIKAYPNPVNGNQITLQYQNTEHHQNMELRCFNVFGKQIHKEKIYPYQGESILDIHNWQSGMYFAIVYSDGKAVGECKFVAQ